MTITIIQSRDSSEYRKLIKFLSLNYSGDPGLSSPAYRQNIPERDRSDRSVGGTHFTLGP